MDWFFLSHRLPLAIAAQENGYRVALASADTGRSAEVVKHGVDFYPVEIGRANTSPTGEIRSVRQLRRVLKRVDPAIVHAVGHKGIFLTALARLGGRRVPMVSAVSGVGSMMIEERSRVARAVLASCYRTCARDRRIWCVFQNEVDHKLFTNARWAAAERSVLIAGSGVDCQAFVPPASEPAGHVVLLPARVIADKGVREFVEAARRVRHVSPQVRFVIAGALDADNPTGIGRSELEGWIREGAIEWWGHCDDMRLVYSRATIVALPSYREGLSKSLIEAAAMGRAIVTTDVPGCREVVDYGRCGTVVPPRNAGRLAAAIRELIQDDSLRERLGNAARKRAVELYDLKRVADATVQLYAQIARNSVDSG